MCQFSHRGVCVIMGLVFAALFLVGSAQGQQIVSPTGTEVMVTPSSSPVLAASRLALLPAGSRVLILSGFDYDIASRDQVKLKQLALSGGRNSTSVIVPSPWLRAGSEVVRRRVATWLRALGPRVSVDSIRVVQPAAFISTQLASATLPYVNQLKGQRSFTPLLARHPALNTALSLGSSVAISQAWSGAIASEVQAASMSAQIGAARAARRGVSVVAMPPLAAPPLPSTGGTVTSVAATNSGVQSTAPSQPATSSSTANSTAAPSTASSASSSTTSNSTPSASVTSLTVQSVTDANLALSNLGSNRKLTSWTGSLQLRDTVWAGLLASVQTDSDVRRCVLAMEDAARSAVSVDRACYVRPQTFDQVIPEQIDNRCYNAGGNKEVFALAMADIGQAHFVRTSGVPLALLAVCTNKPEYLARAIDILSTMRDHQPLQRSGWTAYLPDRQLPPGGDGVFLATSWGLNGIIDMLTILGDRVPVEIRSDLEQLIRNEILRIAADWSVQRPWYVKSHAVQSNQWIEPSIALVRACLFLKDPSLNAAYDLGAENLAASLSAFGEDGAFSEGISYASMTVGSLFDALADMEGNSDFRCHEFPYVKNAWKWFLHMQMPGGRYVNCFDSVMGTVPSWALRTPLPSLISAALGSRDPDALSQVSRFFPVGDASLTAVRYQLALSSRPSVTLNAALDFPTYAHFPTQALAVWRSVWEAPADPQTAMGVWVRGGSLTDSHSHRDQGQVSVYSGIRPILIEAGTPSYADPQMETKYAAAAGHSIMQVAELCPRGQAAVSPLAISRLNADGGRITVDTSAAYLSPVRNCTRTVEWSRSGLVEIFDTVNFDSQIQQGTEIYRFHTGARTAVTLIRNAGGWLIDWNDASMEISSDASFEVVQSFWPDADSPGSGHVMLSIVSSTPLTSMNLSTRVLIKNP
jgi:hypothetical protein